MSSESPVFSVVIPTWNRADLVRRAIGSVLAQTFANFEVVVVDDGSTDSTAAVVAGIDDRRIRYVFQPNRGESAARNVGAQVARGRYLTFLDSDDEVRPLWLERLLQVLESNDAEIVLCGQESVNLESGVSAYWVPEPCDPDLEDIVNHFEAGQVALRRELFLAVGGYSTAIRYGQHTEMAIRLFCARDRRPLPAVVPNALVIVYRRGPGDRDYGSARAESANYVLKHHPGCRRQLPHLWASYQTIVGVDLARRKFLREARRHFGRALRSEPLQWRHLVRLAVALTPVVARRVWPPCPRGVKGGSPALKPALLSVAIAPGLGGSMRSLATVLGGVDVAYRAVACPPHTTFTDFLEERGLCDELVPLPSGGRSRLLARVRATRIITVWAWRQRHQLVAIHANGLAEHNLVALAALLTGAPVVVWMHEWAVSPWARRLGPVSRVLVARTTFAAVSVHARECLVEAGLADRDQIEIVPNPIDPADVVACRRVAHPRVTVAYLGTPAIYKGFHLLPEIIRSLAGEPVRWLIYAGPRTMLPEVWAELDAMRDVDIAVPGKVGDVRQAYESCDIVLCPSLQESFGRVVAEAMCNGLPVVASDIPPLRDLLGQDEAGLLVAPGDVAAAAAALRRLLRDEHLRGELGRAGLRRVVQFEPGPIVARLSGLYGIEL